MHEQQQRFALGERQEVDVPCAEARKENKEFFLAAYIVEDSSHNTLLKLFPHTHSWSGCPEFRNVSGVRGHDFNGNG